MSLYVSPCLSSLLGFISSLSQIAWEKGYIIVVVHVVMHYDISCNLRLVVTINSVHFQDYNCLIDSYNWLEVMNFFKNLDEFCLCDL
jgi:hypothetical protein